MASGRIARLLPGSAVSAAAGGAVLLVLVATGLLLAAPSGDPGGRILNELRPATAAIPVGARIAYRQEVEPRWDSCDGRSGTFGWDDVVVIVRFTTALPPEQMKAHADAALLSLGWMPNYPQHHESLLGYTWTKTLSNGTRARAQVGNAGQSPETWDLYAGAAPVGPRVSGC